MFYFTVYKTLILFYMNRKAAFTFVFWFTSYDSFNDWLHSENQVQYLSDKPLVHEPGQHFYYNTALSHLLSFILTKSTGISTHDFAMEYLFELLGIYQIEWLVDKQGFNHGGLGLKITSNDMVKIGKLILINGVELVCQFRMISGTEHST